MAPTVEFLLQYLHESLPYPHVSGNRISDLASLVGLEKLETLSVCENQISDISDLAELPTLTDLSICSNQITDLSRTVDWLED